ncbi:CDP-glucose 4,6-dehydratase [Leptospira kemamanensis]|uniref:CDP-glucose 4,6-dehydratase n=1 Tax=Leptospira kemamanensis TaxID=2484942 RepID=A0A4R9JPS0_9LEPT|nr:CDP-glucose 4,6-dehydratase [Leptospira kemamanensis]TGL48388.1 CDP-glucose 4,6-dehydratase [Leptospira kemamanensis]
MHNFENLFKNKKAIITGHTGFKGSWLSIWLQSLGAKVIGMSWDIPSTPSLFEESKIFNQIEDHRIDIRNIEMVKDLFKNSQPDFVFHLAAQPLVRLSYKDPILTYSTNVMGTANILDALNEIKKNCIAVILTSDKAYDNVEWVWGYRENDTLGGSDPYSASKGAAELVIKSYIKSYFTGNASKVKIGIGRAGNVIGGGDWANDRIVPDCVRAWSKGEVLQLRNPYATRPWQHVLEPLSGYLNLAFALSVDAKVHGEAFNFGPPSENNHTVLELVTEMQKHWEAVLFEDISSSHDGPYESGLLKLNCDKALHQLKWKAVLDFETTVRMTSQWYENFYNRKINVHDFSLAQIREYIQIAKSKGMAWSRD